MAPHLCSQCLQTGTGLPCLEENPDPSSSLQGGRTLGKHKASPCLCPSTEPVPFLCSLRPGLDSQPYKPRISAVSLPKVPQAPILLSTCQPSEVQTIPQSQCSFGSRVCCPLRDPSPSWGFTYLLWRSESQRPPVAQAGIGHRHHPSFAFPAGSSFELPWLATQTKDGLACCPLVCDSL